MTKITPSVQYVFHQMQALKPYVGAFYRRTDIDGLPDLDSAGALGRRLSPGGTRRTTRPGRGLQVLFRIAGGQCIGSPTVSRRLVALSILTGMK